MATSDLGLPMPTGEHSRRAFLHTALGATGVVLLAACGQAVQPTPATATKPPAAPPPATRAPSPSVAIAPSSSGSPSPKPAASPPADTSASPAVRPTGFPSKAITIIVPFAPGGGYDAVARQISVPMQQTLGQPVVVQNVPGGEQKIAVRQFLQQPADGHTLLFSSDSGIYASTLIQPDDALRMSDWIWAAGVRGSPGGIFVRKDSPYKSIQEVMEADAAGTRLKVAHNGIGGTYLLTNGLTFTALGFKNIGYVAGYNGTADILPALIRGDSDINVLTPLSSMSQYIRSGDIRGLAQILPERNAIIPDVPTALELKLPNLDDLEPLGNLSSGIAVAPGTPADRVSYLGDVVRAALKDPGFMEWARGAGAAPDILDLSGPEFTERKNREYAVFRKYQATLRTLQAG